MQHISKREIIETITPVINNTAMRYNLIPIEISFEKENEKWFLRIYIFANDHDINHKDCENLTHGIGDFLDELIPFKYYLEVSSLGLDRKMKSEKEYLIFKGKNVIVKTKTPIKENFEKKFEAKIVGYLKGIGLKVQKTDTGEEFTISKENILSVQLNEK